MNPFKKRSSWGSAFVTGLVGWLCFSFVGILAFDIPIGSGQLIMLSVAIAVVQVLVLKSLFFLLKMQRGIAVGAIWGLLTAIGLYYLAALWMPELKEQQTYWLIIFAYIGAPVGAFLSYFYRDDQEILKASENTAEETFGRDAHWLEPFAFGALAYLIAFLPFQSLDLSIKVLLIGAIVGVFAAGSSHFSPDAWKHNMVSLFLIIIGLGTLLGCLSALLFRSYAHLLYGPVFTHGIVAGILTLAMTFLRGRQLSIKEAKGQL